MKVLRISLFLLLALFLQQAWCAEPDSSLEKALQLANQGQTDQAVSMLEGLLQKNPNDARIHQSLGFIYQSKDQYDRAISELETAVRISPTGHAWYSLGLLYEAKMLETHDPSWKAKAVGAWNNVVTLAQNETHRATARKHLEQLK